jgi:hypothetical protein
MKILFFTLCLVVGTGVAILINVLLVNRIEELKRRTKKITTVVVCLLLSAFFFLAASIKPWLNDFADAKIELLNTLALEQLPDSEMIKEGVPVSKISDMLQEIKAMDISAITGKGQALNKFIMYFITKQIEGKEDLLARFTGSNNRITLDSALLAVKTIILARLNPFFIIVQLLTVGLLLIYIIYCAYLARGGATYNKSIVYGELVDSGDEKTADRNRRRD